MRMPLYCVGLVLLEELNRLSNGSSSLPSDGRETAVAARRGSNSCHPWRLRGPVAAACVVLPAVRATGPRRRATLAVPCQDVVLSIS